MNVGIFIHSQSGHSSKLGLAITKKLREKGHEVDIQLLKPAGRVRPRQAHVEFRNEMPDFSAYDTVLFGGPIWAFTVSPVVLAFIKEIPSLQGKKALCFTTSGFPTPISGATGAHAKLASELEELGATVLKGELFWWGGWAGAKRIEASAERICETILS